MKVAIQGIKGSYHHEVASKIFGDNIKLIECRNFADMPQMLVSQEADFAVMAIENSIAGAILPNYVYIDNYDLKINQEYYLPINHQLMALSGQSIEEINEVQSHPMALEQCRKFFNSHPHIRLIEAFDTADVAKEIHEKGIQSIAAIASRKASEMYNLNILAENIQTNNDNYTRFFVISTEGEHSNYFNKSSIKFVLPHISGSLLTALQCFAENDINMTKIQSLPLIDKPWEYAFFADLVFETKDQFYKAIENLSTHASEIKVFGKYFNRLVTNEKSN